VSSSSANSSHEAAPRNEVADIAEVITSNSSTKESIEDINSPSSSTKVCAAVAETTLDKNETFDYQYSQSLKNIHPAQRGAEILSPET
jgi:hypothetical protein